LSFISTMSRIMASGSAGVLAQREGHVVEHREVGEQRAELEQHAQAAAQAVQLRAVAHVDHLAVEHHAALLAACTPPIRRISVVLPQPDPPRMAVTLPRGKFSEMSDRMCRLAS
jgi:hypothetical protein